MSSVFLKKIAEPNFAENFNLNGNIKGGLDIVNRKSGRSLLGSSAEREAEILLAAKKLAEISERPNVFKGLNSNELTQFSKNLKILQARMIENVDPLDKTVDHLMLWL